MTAPLDDWERWRESWVDGGEAPPLMGSIRQQFRREQRRIVLTVVAEVVLAVAAGSGIAAALVHTPSRPPVTWGAAILFLIALMIVVDLVRRRREWRPLTESTQTFLELSLRRCRGQRHALRLTWVLIALELVFFIPWWAGGLRAHFDELRSPVVILLGWLPMSVMAGLFVWTLVLWRRLTVELNRLLELTTVLSDN
jgi:hypothetical protein